MSDDMYAIGRVKMVKAIRDIIKVGLVPHIQSPPGEGKTTLGDEVANLENKLLIPINATSYLKEDVNGIPYKQENGKANFMVFDTFPIEGDELPKDKDGWVLFIDELDSVEPDIRVAFQKVIQDKKVGTYNLHPAVSIITAGNRITDNATNVTDLGTALKSRLIHLTLRVTVEEWVHWANMNGIDPRIIAFVNFKKEEVLHSFDPELTDSTFACPRTLEFLSKLIADKELKDIDYLIAGTIGESLTPEFILFDEYFSQIPSIDEIINNKFLVIPTEPAIQYSIIQYLIHVVDETNMDSILNYLLKFPPEFQIIFGRNVHSMNPSFYQKNKDFQRLIINVVKM